MHSSSGAASSRPHRLTRSMLSSLPVVAVSWRRVSSRCWPAKPRLDSWQMRPAGQGNSGDVERVATWGPVGGAALGGAAWKSAAIVRPTPPVGLWSKSRQPAIECGSRCSQKRTGSIGRACYNRRFARKSMPCPSFAPSFSVFLCLPLLALAQQLPTPPALAAKSWLLVEVASGQNSPHRRPISASNRPR
jgi:hypothetical protein